MNEALKLSLAFAGGAAVGVLCTWQFFLSKKEKEVQEEIEICREVYAKHFEDGEFEKLREAYDSSIDGTVGSNDIRQEPIPEEERVPYHKMYKGRKTPGVEIDADDLEEEGEKSDYMYEGEQENQYQNRHKGQVFVIDENEYGEKDYIEKRQASFYVVDGVLVDDEEDSVMSRLENQELYRFLDRTPSDTEEIFVRDMRYNYDWRISIDLAAYGDD